MKKLLILAALCLVGCEEESRYRYTKCVIKDIQPSGRNNILITTDDGKVVQYYIENGVFLPKNTPIEIQIDRYGTIVQAYYQK